MMKTIIALAACLLMTSCARITPHPQAEQSLSDILEVGQNLLSRDTIEQAIYPIVSEHQRSGLTRLTTLEVPDSILFIGVRPAGEGFTLEAYKVPTGDNPNQFKVYLIICDKKDVIVDYLDLFEFHTSEHQGPMRLGGNRFYTTDASITFDDDRHFTLHRVMTLVSIYLKNHTLTEGWRVEWDNHYEITNTGDFIFKGQEETLRSPSDIADPMIDEYKSRDLQIRSTTSQ